MPFIGGVVNKKEVEVEEKEEEVESEDETPEEESEEGRFANTHM